VTLEVTTTVEIMSPPPSVDEVVELPPPPAPPGNVMVVPHATPDVTATIIAAAHFSPCCIQLIPRGNARREPLQLRDIESVLRASVSH
jgi:hypothetical protein